jgi:lipid A 3-O-deacylase
MRRGINILFWLLPFCPVQPQNDPAGKKFIRIYADNDALITSKGASDWGYTGGHKGDFFYHTKKKGPGIFNKIHQTAAKDLYNTAGWSIMQMIFTPKKYELPGPRSMDYPFSGALVLIHTLHSANDIKKLNLQSEWVAGIMGPPSFARETQEFFHRVIREKTPLGWDYQLPADLLLNYKLTLEKQLRATRLAEITGGIKTSLGTMHTGFSVFNLVRLQKKLPYFSGLPNQVFTSRKGVFGYSLALKSTAELTIYNALLDGGLFNKQSPVKNKNSEYGTRMKRNWITGELEMMLLVAFHRLSASLTQRVISPEYKNFSSHNVGNISLYFEW